jgi:multidrug efflux system membrane fusion protein
MQSVIESAEEASSTGTPVRSSRRGRFWGGGLTLLFTVAGLGAYVQLNTRNAGADVPPTNAPQAVPVSVAVVEPRDAVVWDEFSGRLEAVERVDVRPRVAGAVQAVHFREGALVKQGDLLVTIDPAPYAAEVERAQAQVLAAEARLVLARGELERGQRLWDSRTVSQRDLDTRLNGQREAEANLRAAQAALQLARLNLGYTQVRAPVSGRVGRLEVTVGNLVAAGAAAPVLTTLVSLDPIYASFNADEGVVTRALKQVSDGSPERRQIDRIPVHMMVGGESTSHEGRLQLIDNQVDASSGTVRVRATFSNADGSLIPGQFARLRMGQAKPERALLVHERAIGTDQDKKFVLVVEEGNRVAYRPVTLGPSVDGLRIVFDGIKPGERIVVNGLQRVRPGALVQPEEVPMDAATRKPRGVGRTELAQR